MITKEWFVGFIEGEGNFNVSLSKYSKKEGILLSPTLQFRIFLREDDIEALNKIKTFLGFGQIYHKKTEYNRNKGMQAQDQYAFYVTNVDDLLKLKEILQEVEFNTKKEKDFKIFYEIFDLKRKKEHLTTEGNKKIVELANQMNSKNRNHWKPK
jgi:hypothetical protein